MSQLTNRDAPRAGASVDDRLARWLDSPCLARVVPLLPPETLHEIVRHVGLHACTDLVTSATPAQLTSLLDIDLWRHAAAGRDHLFDVERFGEWIEVLADVDAAVAARTVAALDETLVVAGLSRYVRVLDPGIFEPIAQSDDEPGDRHQAMREGDPIGAGEAGATRLECHVGGFVVRARRASAWDAIVTTLTALEAGHGDCFRAVMRGCRRLSHSRAEIDGLDNLLAAPEQHLHDVTIEREARRSRQGYATPADARAFLQMARQPRGAGSGAATTATIERNPIVTAYFRAADETPESSTEAARSTQLAPHSSPLVASAAAQPSGGAALAAQVSESLAAIMDILADAGATPNRPRALLEGAADGPQATRLTHLRRLMAYVHDTHETAYVTSHRELAFLANVLVAGGSVQSRAFTPQEASDAAAATCNLGLEYWPARWPVLTSPATAVRHPRNTDTASPPDAFLTDHDLVTAFEVGWSVLHQDVSLFAAKQLIAILGDLDSVDRDIRRGLVALRRTLVEQHASGTPWHAREAAEILSILDTTAWIGVIGVLDECPVVPAALTAVLDGRTTSVSPTAFDFISTAAQIEDVHRFLRKLPDVLSR